jgi:PST family polysaccharide transporter
MFSLSILQIANYVLPIITLPIISRIIGPEKYGLINYVSAFAGYFVLVINSGYDIYGTRGVVASQGDMKKVQALFNNIFFSKFFLLIVSLLIFSICVFLIPQLKSEKLISYFSFFLCVGWVLNPSWLYHGMQDSKKFAIFSFTTKLLFTILIIILIRHKSDYIYQPIATSLVHILVSAISLYYACKRYNIKIRFVSWENIRQTIKENFNLSISWWINNQTVSTSIVLAGLVLSNQELGIYSAPLRIIMIIQSIVLLPIGTVLYPYIGEAFAKNDFEGLKKFQLIFPLLFLVSLLLFIATFFASNFIIIGFYGTNFYASVNLLRIFSIVLFFSNLNNAFGLQVLLNLKRDNVYRNFLLLSFIVNSLLVITLVYAKRELGAAYAWPISELLLMLSYIFYFKRKNIKIIELSYFKINSFYKVTDKLLGATGYNKSIIKTN